MPWPFSVRWHPTSTQSPRTARAGSAQATTAAALHKRGMFAIALLIGGSCWGAPTLSAWRPVSPPSLLHTAEFAFQVKGKYENPFDPDQVRVDADVTGPGGRSWTMPAFWMQPCAMQVGAPNARWAGLTFMQFFIVGASSPRGKPVRFALCDAALENSKTGQRRPLPAFTDPATWTCAAGVTVEAGQGPGGKPSLTVTIVPEGKGYPGIRMVPKGALSDWSASDTLRFQGKRLEGVGAAPVRFEVRQGKHKQSSGPFRGPRQDQGWKPVTWRYNRQLPSVSWAAPGDGEWRLRVAAPEAGVYRIALRATDQNGDAAESAHSVRLDKTTGRGFIQVAPQCPRYLRYDSGEPFFSIGTNLLVFNRNFGEYQYYMDRFTKVGVNLFRVWLDNPRLGFEKVSLGRYEPQECAVLDALVNGAGRRDATLMLCLLDHREVIEREHLPTGGWERNPYHALCSRASEFFTDDRARWAFRKRLRYLVARWAASPAVHSWEFFNEVAYCDAWRRGDNPDAVRAWHAEMAAELRRIDPYRHLITTSRGGSQPDPLWEQPLMEIVQPHCYQTASVDFASFLRKPCMNLAQYGKPVLMGEFGLMTVKYEDVLEGGVSVHNGMWASVMSGCCGAAMPWWWDWIDRHNHYPHIEAVAKFVRGVRWHEQAFEPIASSRLEVVVPKTAKPTPGAVTLALERHTWDATAAYNHPAQVQVASDGSTDPPGCLSTRLHGLRNHRDCHNPKTFLVDYPLPGRFVVGVAGVSGYGGADLRISLDGREALFKDFVDEDKQLRNVMQQYRGAYGIDVPRGRHEIEIVNRGNDWIEVSHIRLENYGSTPLGLQAMGLVGKTTAMIWLRNEDYSWFGHMTKRPCRAVANARLTVTGLPSGPCGVRFYAPQTASWMAERAARVVDGRLELALPPFSTDVAAVVSQLNCPAATAAGGIR